MTQPLEGKVAFITGGARGIGRAVCEAMSAAGAKVVVADMNEDDAVKTARSVNGMACLLYTSPSPRDKRQSRMPSSA